MGKKKVPFTVNDLQMLFGHNVRYFRAVNGWSQEKLAELVNVSKNTIHGIETGRKFAKAKTLVKLAIVFNIEVYHLLLPQDCFEYSKAEFIKKNNEYVKDVVDNRYEYFKK